MGLSEMGLSVRYQETARQSGEGRVLRWNEVKRVKEACNT